ncbi:TetR/AcrR family transcriptional regulator [Gemmatimonadota bacterium]
MSSSYQKESQKEKIIIAAVQLFSSTHNFNKVSIEDIAREANISPTTIYNNFGNRNNLVVELIKHITLVGLETYKAIIRSDIPFPEKIKLSMNRKMDAVAGLDWNVIDKMVSQDTRLAEFAAEINEKESKPLMNELIEDGKRQGYIEPSLSNQAIMMYFEVLQASGSAFFRIINAPGVNPESVQDLNRILFYGFINKEKEK